MYDNVLKIFEKQLDSMAPDIPHNFSVMTVIDTVYSSMQETCQKELDKVPYIELKHIVLQVGIWE